MESYESKLDSKAKAKKHNKTSILPPQDISNHAEHQLEPDTLTSITSSVDAEIYFIT